VTRAFFNFHFQVGMNSSSAIFAFQFRTLQLSLLTSFITHKRRLHIKISWTLFCKSKTWVTFSI